MSEFPVTLNLTCKRVLIVGGGKIAKRKISSLLGCGALLTVVSPSIDKDIRDIASDHHITLIEREVTADDLKDAFLIITTADSSKVNDFVVKHAGENQLVNASHESGAGNVSLPATLRQGRLNISVSTGGASPLLAKKIRDELAMKYDYTYRDYVERLYQLRVIVKQMNLKENKRKKILEKALEKEFLES
ncbi:NAD(P)-dependent oxidoreductase [Pseudalkalibacillus hwajinpoensis]|uniref:NAD(P)-dependent oxidoreductase n=1 Tax=Guptibacillus hwajinpoensis TaxID=208199 RepID=UPI00325BAF01